MVISHVELKRKWFCTCSIRWRTKVKRRKMTSIVTVTQGGLRTYTCRNSKKRVGGRKDTLFMLLESKYIFTAKKKTYVLIT